MQEVSHHGQIIREYRELRVGITQEELARRVGRSRRTIVSVEQSACVSDPKLRRALAWALEIPPQMLGLSEAAIPGVATLSPLAFLSSEEGSESKGLNRMIVETFIESLRMRLDLYYLGSALAADRGLSPHIGELEKLMDKANSKWRLQLLTLLSHTYQLKGMIARDQLVYEVAEKCFVHSAALAVEAECVELNALAMARRANMRVWQKRLNEADQLYDVAREITKRSVPGLRAFLATGHAEVQGLLKDKECLGSLTEARTLLARVDLADDPYAEALYIGRDMSCCFYAVEGLKLARSVGSQYNINRVRELASKLTSQFPRDERVMELLRVVQG